MSEVVVDASGIVLGRLASYVSKLILEGEVVVVINAEKAVITGRKESIIEKMHYRNDDSSPEEIAAKDADLIECALQAREYIDKGFKEAQDWLDNIRQVVKTKTAKKMLELNYTVDNICAVTGLSKKEVEGLKG